MSTFRSSFLAPALLSLVSVLAGCSAETTADGEDSTEADFSSNQATLLDFEFDASLVTDASFNDKQTIQSQLLFTIGHLNTNHAVGRLDNLVLSNIQKTDQNGKVTISYHAKLPVAWGSKSSLPTSYTFKLPKDVSFDAQEKFTEAHKQDCIDFGAHDLSSGNMWYYYRPLNAGCRIAGAELIETTAKVSVSSGNTTGKFPEYQKVWDDDRLEVVSIFGKFEATGGAGDAGVDAFNSFVRNMKTELRGQKLVTTPAQITSSTKDVTFEATLADGKTVKVTALLVDAITQTGPDFDARYESLTPTADLIVYSGHAGLGQNVRALARKGKWSKGKYQMFFMNGCDTFAYVDGSLAQTRAALNPEDPTGTKYMEFITNAMPSFFASMADASTAMVKGLLSYNQPKTYEKIFEGIDRSEVVLVTGEEDNEFKPGMAIGKASAKPKP